MIFSKTVSRKKPYFEKKIFFWEFGIFRFSLNCRRIFKINKFCRELNSGYFGKKMSLIGHVELEK